MWWWVLSPFYDFCSFWSMAVNAIDKLQFFIIYLYFIKCTKVSVTFVAAAVVVLWSLPYPACQLSSQRDSLSRTEECGHPPLIGCSCEWDSPTCSWRSTSNFHWGLWPFVALTVMHIDAMHFECEWREGGNINVCPRCQTPLRRLCSPTAKIWNAP